MEKGMFLRDVERPSREGLLTWREEEVRREETGGDREDQQCRTNEWDHLTGGFQLMSARILACMNSESMIGINDGKCLRCPLLIFSTNAHTALHSGHF